MPKLNGSLKITCQKVVQNNVEFFIGKLPFKDLEKIVTVTQRIILGFDEDGLPIYNRQIQRRPNTTRVNAIKNYLLLDESASFPNSILLSVPSILLADEISNTGEIYTINIDLSKIDLESEESPLYVQIIDGQHRFRGMQVAVETLGGMGHKEMLDELMNFEFVVSFFIDPEIDFQAMLFSTINRTPVKVSQDIVYDLFGVMTNDSPQKTALAICLELNASRKDAENRKSPFYKRIRLLGKKEKGESAYISQAIFIKTIVTLISPNLRISEIERFKSRDYFLSGGTNRTIFREFYAKGNDNFIFRTLENFFTAVRDTFINEENQSYWDLDSSAPDNAFRRTIGFLALIEVLVVLFPIGVSENKLSVDFFKSHLSRAKSINLLNENNESIYPYSSKGKSMLTDELLSLILGKLVLS